jgi:hypothetical protein
VQLGALPEPAPLVLVPRRQMRRLNSQLEFLGEAAEVVIDPDDAGPRRACPTTRR